MHSKQELHSSHCTFLSFVQNVLRNLKPGTGNEFELCLATCIYNTNL